MNIGCSPVKLQCITIGNSTRAGESVPRDLNLISASIELNRAASYITYLWINIVVRKRIIIPKPDPSHRPSTHCPGVVAVENVILDANVPRCEQGTIICECS